MIQSPAGYQGDVRIKRYLDFYQAGYGVAMLSSGTTAFTPASLFAASEPGGWYDPSDLTTLYQDAAGTTPVTAVEQPVGRVLDKSGNGNHLSQSTTAARPVLSARVNLLTQTEDIGNAVWLLNGATKGGKSSVVMPDGSTNGQIINITAAANKGVYQNVTLTPTSYTWTVVLAAVSGTQVARLAYFDGTSQSQSSDITVTTTPTRYTWTFTGASAAGNVSVINGSANAASNIIVWGADLRPANAGVGLPAYQRVGAATSGSSTAAGNADYDTTGFPLYLKFDGTDDFLQSGTITPGSVDKAQVFAGVRYTQSSGAGIVYETSASWAANNGALYQASDTLVAGQPIDTGSRGAAAFAASQYVSFSTNGYPKIFVTSAAHDISGDLTSVKFNGATAVNATGDKGSGNFLDYPLYVGRRGGTTLPASMNLYSLILRFSAANLDAATITATETWVNSKTLAY